jgi:SAM-dependent methyltransferase
MRQLSTQRRTLGIRRDEAFASLTRAPEPLPTGEARGYGARAMRVREAVARPYARQGHDPVRFRFEERRLGRLVPRLLDLSGGGALLDLGCADGLVARLAGERLSRYLGLDLEPTTTSLPAIPWDLRNGLAELGERPFDLYLGYFGIASHLTPEQLRRLLRDVVHHARPGAVVALEALGLYSLEWPRLWETSPGPARVLPYRLAADVAVHPWAPHELLALFDEAGIAPLGALDRTLQAAPKTGEGRYWRGLPAVRGALNGVLRGESPPPSLAAPLPPLPAGLPALVHHTLAARRRELVLGSGKNGPALADAIWELEPSSAGGFGHGLLAIGRLR